MNLIRFTRTILRVSAFVALLLFSCTPKKNTTQTIPVDIAFFEYYVTLDGKALQGDPPPGMRIDGPTYAFDPEGMAINSYINPNIKPNEVIAILGLGRILRGTEGGGLSSRLVGIFSFPHSENNITILEIKKDVAKIDLLGETIYVKIGQTIDRVFESTDSIPFESQMAIIQRTITHQVSFHGYVKRGNLFFPKEE